MIENASDTTCTFHTHSDSLQAFVLPGNQSCVNLLSMQKLVQEGTRQHQEKSFAFERW